MTTLEFDFHPDSEQLPPQELTAEACVLGSMLLAPTVIAEVTDILTRADFYRPNNATIYGAIIDLYAAGEPADALTVAAALTDQGLLARVGGANYLHTLIAQVPNAASAGWYAQLVRRAAEDRNLVEAGTRIAQLGRNPERDPENPKHGQASKILYDAISIRTTDTLTPVGDLINDTLAAIEEGPQPGLSTGFPDLDDLTGGLGDGQLWFVGGRPAMGKSVAVMDLARAVAIGQHLPVLYFSLEMTKKQLMMRILSAESGVAHKRLKMGGSHVTDADWANLSRASGRIGDAPLMIDETPELSIVDIQARSRRRAAAGALGLIVIDHIHLMTGVGGKANENREQELARISKGLKILAKDMQVPIVAAGQLNRGPEQRNDKRPQMSDLRDSGSLEQDADVVILLHRDDYYDKESARAGEADFIVAKNRDGEADTITVAAQLHLARFASMAI